MSGRKQRAVQAFTLMEIIEKHGPIVRHDRPQTTYECAQTEDGRVFECYPLFPHFTERIWVERPCHSYERLLRLMREER